MRVVYVLFMAASLGLLNLIYQARKLARTSDE